MVLAVAKHQPSAPWVSVTPPAVIVKVYPQVLLAELGAQLPPHHGCLQSFAGLRNKRTRENVSPQV